MKYFLKPTAIILLAATVFFTNTAKAAPNTIFANTDSSKINPAKDLNDRTTASTFSLIIQPLKNVDRVRMIIEKEKGKKLQVRLLSPDGYSIIAFTTDKKSESVLRKFNFIDADEGVYTIEVTDGTETITKKIKLQRTKVEIKTTLEVE